jgi:hypothetical protein
MTIRLGYFEEFKGGNVLLIALDREEVAILRRELTMAATQKGPYPLHEIALAARLHPAQLFVASPERNGAQWRAIGCGGSPVRSMKASIPNWKC